MNDKSVLEKALQSPDTIVRHAAIRRMQIEEEIGSLDAFLSFYAGTQTDNTAVSDSPKLQSPVAVDHRKIRTAARDSSDSKQPKVGKGPRLAEAVRSILVPHGKPMQLQELFDALQVKHLDICPPKIDSLRPRLHEQRDKIAMIKGRGYWPANVEIPA